MGKIKPHPPVKIFTALTFISSFDLRPVFEELTSHFSPIESKSHIYDFSEFTHYYQKEMGAELNKTFVVFSELYQPDQLPHIKIKTNQIEKKYATKGKRRVNIDPGYLTPAKIVLATTKNYSHRIYLAHDIYGDLHLYFHQGSFRKQPWTYPDYQQQEIILFFNKIRQSYLEQLGIVYQQ
jgi:hypothetical protein